MGDYLHKAYEDGLAVKALQRLNSMIDKEQQKLSDKLEHLTLSHNRKAKALRKIAELMENYTFIEAHDKQLQQKILTLCNNALFSNGREKYYWGRK